MNELAKHIVKTFNDDISYFEKIKWVAYFNKYNEEHLCFQDKWNYSVSNLVSEELTENKAINVKPLRPFYEWLGERIALCLNLSRGFSNEELKVMLDAKMKEDSNDKT